MTLKAALRGGKVVLLGNKVRLGEDGDERPCKCCAAECESEVTVTVEWCGMSVTLTVPIPGSSGFVEDPDPPPDSSLQADALISCTGCGWELVISVCAYCAATTQFASDAFTAFIPFANSEEAGGGYCPEPGAVELTCFGEQFGIPCITTVSATIA